jgi:hypothetical protein
MGWPVSLRDDLIALLSPPYEVLPLDANGTYLITRHGGQLLDPPARLQLTTESVFEQYAARLAVEAQEVDARAALGLIYVHIDEELTADTASGPVIRLGIRSRRIGRASWFVDRLPTAPAGNQATAVWLADPPER